MWSNSQVRFWSKLLVGLHSMAVAMDPLTVVSLAGQCCVLAEGWVNDGSADDVIWNCSGEGTIFTGLLSADDDTGYYVVEACGLWTPFIVCGINSFFLTKQRVGRVGLRYFVKLMDRKNYCHLRMSPKLERICELLASQKISFILYCHDCPS